MVFYLCETHFVPSMKMNLISIQSLSKDSKCNLNINKNGFVVKDNQSGNLLLSGNSLGGLYHLHPRHLKKNGVVAVAFLSKVWHHHCGHSSTNILKQLDGMYNLNCKPSKNNCVVCPVYKLHKLPFISKTSYTNVPLSILHMDVWGVLQFLL